MVLFIWEMAEPKSFTNNQQSKLFGKLISHGKNTSYNTSSWGCHYYPKKKKGWGGHFKL
jgi:hypothetical protein